ncbi:MAG: hypothetical protein ABJB12_03895 [Pseudomonadota bacterium]
MIDAQEIGTHGLVEPFEPVPKLLPLEVVEIYQHIIDRETPAYLAHRPEFVAEERRRAKLLLELHEIAMEQEQPGAREP